MKSLNNLENFPDDDNVSAAESIIILICVIALFVYITISIINP